MLRLNLVLLMVTAFLPFPTGILAEALPICIGVLGFGKVAAAMYLVLAIPGVLLLGSHRHRASARTA